ncbi:hypothetical protein SAMN05216298_3798 [Glycomyces sambucus]|uniref:Uncharacterized protein n=1 Tax=Glycomyces sambucus TaxID=380244 RepID=A0A1G9JQU1_9ACTN|nr:hypothetical protein [Glycomyces sambucus]SDL39585.1 hypothetical protein SAMN05216298_3798 [Glycomyces sambucus]
MTEAHDGVRPTKRCLDDLDLKAPDLGQPLEEINDSLVIAAQTIPARRDTGGAERIASLKDRIWFKVKTGTKRAVVTQLRGGDLPGRLPPGVATWWLGAAGHRQADSPQRDFYACLARECTKGTLVSTEHLLPQDWDWNRLLAEQAVAWKREMKQLVIRLIVMSLRSGDLAIAEFQNYRLKALVRADEGHESFLAIMTEGVLYPEVFAVLLASVPGIDPGDWFPEPSPLADMEPSSGEIIWSTVMPPEVANSLLELGDEMDQ